MNIVFFLSIFSVLGIVYFIVGAKASKNIKTTTDYFLAGRNLGLIPVMFTLVATQLGGGLLLGTSAEAYNVGYYGILYTLGMALGFMLLGLGFASKLQSLNVATTAELFETRYQSPNLKRLASLLSIATLCGILVAQIIAARTLLAGLWPGDNELILILFWVGVIAYTMVGGLKAVVATDTLQVGIIVAIFVGIFLYALLTGQFEALLSCSQLAKTQSLFATKQISLNSLIGVALMPALFSLIEQDLAQRFFAARTKKIAAFAALGASGILIAFSIIPLLFGMKARLLGYVVEGSSPLMPVIGYLAGDFVLALAACAIVAAITSTADSLLCAISSNISEDFGPLLVKTKNKLKLSKIITLLTGVAAITASYLVKQNIIDVLVGSYELSVSCLLVPLLFAYFVKNPPKSAAIGAIACGLAGFVLFRMPNLLVYFMGTHPTAPIGPAMPLMIPREIITLGMSLLGYAIGYLANRQK